MLLRLLQRFLLGNELFAHWYLTLSIARHALVRRDRARFLWKVRHNTLVSYKRLVHLFDVIDIIEQKQISGAYVECGVWKGGSAAILAAEAQRRGNQRNVYLFDSFEGMPEPSEGDGDKARVFAGNASAGRLKSINKFVGPVDDVEQLLFSTLGLSRERIIFGKGWFQDTLPAYSQRMEPIAILRLDADWYESTKICLETLYDKVVPGGYIIFDDYGYWEGCRKAAADFFSDRHTYVRYQKIDSSGVFVIKPDGK